MRKHRIIGVAIFFVGLLFAFHPAGADKKVRNPTLEQAPDGSRTLLLPDDLTDFLTAEFPAHRFPKASDFAPEMLQYFFSRLIGVHPAVAYGDFNGDKKREYALLIITGDTKWGPLCELVILNGARGGYAVFRLKEIYDFKQDYVSFVEGKLYKGRYKKGGLHVNWDKKKNTYLTCQS